MSMFVWGIVTGLGLAAGLGHWAGRAAQRKHDERTDAEAGELGLIRRPGEDSTALWGRIVEKRVEAMALELAEGALEAAEHAPGPSIDAVVVGLRDGAPWGQA